MSDKRTSGTARPRKASVRSIFQSAPARVMVPRLLVILPTVALLAVGLVMVYSSSSITGYVEQGDATQEMVKQVGFTLVGVIFALVAIFVARQDFMRGTGGLVFWGICVLFLLLTPIIGTAALGAKRWIVLGPVSIQISEFVKIAVVIMAARIFDDYQRGELGALEFVIQIAVFLVLPLAMILGTQSDLGSTAICAVGIVTVLVCSGMSGRIIVGLAIVGVIVLLVAVFGVSYRSDRLSFIDPWADAQGTGYQLIHSFKAFASGGLFGSGVGNSYEKMLWLPEAETDFIFAIVGEELGFVGAIGVVAAFLCLLVGGFLIARDAKTRFGKFVAAGLTVMVVFQAFLNICCVIGLAPTTGKPLPFISSGGSSLISSLLLVGLILAISFDSSNEGEYRQRRDNLRVVSSQGSSDAARPSASRSPHRGPGDPRGRRSRSPRATVSRDGTRRPRNDVPARRAQRR